MKNIFILEDQIKGIELIHHIIKRVFGDDVTIRCQRKIQAVTHEDLSSCEIAFIDLSLPDGLSFETITQCKSLNPDIPVIVTTLYDEDEMVFNALQAGADGYLLKSDGRDKLTQCLRRILNGEPPISPQIARKLMSQFNVAATENAQQEQPAPQLAQLSSRENQVLALIAQGLVTKEIARHLELSIHTINGVIKSIYKKLGVNNRAQAAAVALNSQG